MTPLQAFDLLAGDTDATYRAFLATASGPEIHINKHHFLDDERYFSLAAPALIITAAGADIFSSDADEQRKLIAQLFRAHTEDRASFSALVRTFNMALTRSILGQSEAYGPHGVAGLLAGEADAGTHTSPLLKTSFRIQMYDACASEIQRIILEICPPASEEDEQEERFAGASLPGIIEGHILADARGADDLLFTLTVLTALIPIFTRIVRAERAHIHSPLQAISAVDSAFAAAFKIAAPRKLV